MLRLCRNHDLADDIAQDTFIAAYKKLSTYKAKGSFRAWLMGIGYKLFLQRVRTNTRRDEVILAYQAETEIQRNRFNPANDLQIDLEKAMLQIKPEQAAAITLCYSYGHSHQEAAAILCMPIGTIKTNIARGKAQLRVLLETTNLTDQNHD